MKLSAPKMYTWGVAVLLGVLGLVGHYAASLPVVGRYNFWFVVVGLVVLILGTVVDQL